jgi:hypothetical protein
LRQFREFQEGLGGRAGSSAVFGSRMPALEPGEDGLFRRWLQRNRRFNSRGRGRDPETEGLPEPKPDTTGPDCG